MHDSETVRTVKCGAGCFTIDSLDVVTQYDHIGRVVGIFRSEDAPALSAWLAAPSKNETPMGRRPSGLTTSEDDQ